MTGIKRPLVQDLPYSSTPCSIADPIEAGGIHLRAVVSPSWSSQQDNYDAGFAFAIRANVGVPCDLTGIEASTSHGRRLLIVNAGSASLTIKNESGSSTAVNRFALSADLVLAAGNSAELWYDETSTRWRAVSAPSTGGGGGSSDHGALTGLSDDDHTQYHNNARGDARYSQIGHAHDAADVVYDNTSSGLAATDVQAAIDELAASGGGGSDRSAVTALSISSGTVTVDYDAGDYFTLALTSDVTDWAFDNMPGVGYGARLTIRITQDDPPHDLEWPLSFMWEGGLPKYPQYAAGVVSMLTLVTFDGGSSFVASLVDELEFPPLPGSDPYFSYVVSLLNFAGGNGSTTFADATGKTWTAHVNAQIDTSLGFQSGYFDGASWIDTADSDDFAFGNGDFTIEAVVRVASFASGNRQTLFAQFPNSVAGGQNGVALLYQDVYVNPFWSSNGVDYPSFSAAATISVGVDTHIAWVRDGGLMRVYVNGTHCGSSAVSGSLHNSTFAPRIGTLADNALYMNARVRAFRVTKGICRYPSGTTFTAPTAPFPES